MPAIKTRTVGACILLALLALPGCRSGAGMFCQAQEDCRAGLTCRKAAPDGGDAGASAHGVCLPALSGRGQVCLRSEDCETGLRCSNEVGAFVGDNRHGLCEPIPARDAGADLTSIIDAGDSDAGPPDGGRDGG